MHNKVMSKYLAALGLLLMTTIGAQASSLNDIFNASYILSKNGSEICSSQVIKDDGKLKLLTAAHCVDDVVVLGPETFYTIVQTKVDEDLNPISANVFFLKKEKVNESDDTALLTFLDPSFESAYVDVGGEVAKGLLKPGTEVVAAHFPLNTGARNVNFDDGIFNGYVKSPGSLSDLNNRASVTSLTTGGSSGSGIYIELGEGNYQLVGTLSGGANDWSNYYSTLDDVLEVIGTQQ